MLGHPVSTSTIRRVLKANPDRPWTAQQIRNLLHDTAARCSADGWGALRGPSRARGPTRYLGRNDTVVTFLSLSPPSPTPEPVNLVSASMLPLNPCPANWIAAMTFPDSVITELAEIV